MATQFKYTAQRGKNALKDIVIAAGAAEAQSETISLNVDYTKLTRGEALDMIEGIVQKIIAGKWPPL